MKKLQKWLPGFLIFAVLLVSMLGGAAFGKYIYSEKLGGKVTITANLGSIDIWESKAIRDQSGAYTLDESQRVKKNSYDLLPGLDIPKDPYVAVDKASAIPVYVFVEVVSKLGGSAVSFEVDTENWIKISASENNGVHGGTVYVYTGGGATAKAIENESFTACILKGNQVTVGQELLHGTPVNLGLDFYACMGEVAAGKSGGTIDLEAVYNNAK